MISSGERFEESDRRFVVIDNRLEVVIMVIVGVILNAVLLKEDRGGTGKEFLEAAI